MRSQVAERMEVQVCKQKFEVQMKMHKEVCMEGNLKECTEIDSAACLEVHMELRRNDRKDGSVE